MWLEKKYINLLSPKLSRFKWKSPNLANCRCPLCLDSQQSEKKARGYLYEKDGTWIYHCHNCTNTLRFVNLLKQMDPRLHAEFKLELLKDKPVVSLDEWKTETSFEVDANRELEKLTRLSHLPEDHPARKYFLSRKIPLRYFEEFRWCPTFKWWTNQLIPGKFENTRFDEGRIIIPYFSQKKDFFAYSGRSLNDSGLRYVKIVLNSTHPNIFGLDKINVKKDVFVFEGELDSCFFDNAVGCGGQNINQLTYVAEPDIFVIVLDNEPRSKETRGKMENAILQGFRVCIWPDSIEHKDINKMVLSGYSPAYLQTVIEQNTFRGLRAKARLVEWSKR